MTRNLNLSVRVENVREQHEICRVVHFNLQEIKDRFDQSVDSILNKFVLFDELFSEDRVDEAYDVLRSQIVFLEGIIDFYIHEMTKYSYFKMFLNEWNKTSQYKNFKVKMEVVERGLHSPDSKEWFFEYVSSAFDRVVFLSSESLHEQLNAIGIPYNEVMHGVFKERLENKSVKKGNAFISSLFRRRNEIVHQNDRSHDSAIQNTIDKEYVLETIETVQKIVQQIYEIANCR